jgi:hypothetical protein
MRIFVRRAALGATALIAVLAFGATSARAQNKCLSGKTKCVNKKMSGLLKCHNKAEKKGLAVDPVCVQKAIAKFDGGTKGFEKSCFGKLELKYPLVTGDPPCVTFGDLGAQEAKVDAFVLDVVQELDPGYPTPILNKCSAGKKKCVLKKASGLLKCREKCEKDPVKCGAVLTACIDKVIAKFDGGTKGFEKSCFGKLEIKNDGPCQTFGDLGAMEAKVDAFVADVRAELESLGTVTPTPTVTATPTVTVTPTPCTTATPGGSCPTQVETEVKGDATETDLDVGWTGQSHDSHTGSMGRLTLQVSGCAGSEPPTCGVCNTTGPIANAGGTAYNNHRCVGDTATECTADSDCGGSGPCAFFFGGPLALSAGGVSVCVTNQITQPVSGTVDVEAGTTQAFIELLSRVHTGPTADKPCPNCRPYMCIGGGLGANTYASCTTNGDCTLGGICEPAPHCDSGPHASGPCTVNSQSPLFGALSFDCPPDSGGNVGSLPIPLNYTTGTQTWSLSADRPTCTAPGFTSRKCFCDTCDNENAEPCNGPGQCPMSCRGGTNNGVTCVDASECPGGSCVGGTCGGRRCQGGANNGTPCTTASQCPGGGCGTPGKATATNECADAVCSPNLSDTDSVNEGTCEAGPYEQFCGPHATYTSCFGDAECLPFNRCVGGPKNNVLGCTADSDCPSGTCEIQTCSLGKNRECFTDNGVIGTHCFGGTNAEEPCADLTECPDQSAGTFCGGGSISTSGSPYPICGGAGTGAVGTLFCVGPTSSGSVNAVSGIPGPGRITLPVTVKFN